MNQMLKYIIKRILILFPILFGILILTWILSRYIPGDPVLGNLPLFYTQAQYDAMKASMGLNDPWIVQLGNYLLNFFQGDLGKSGIIVQGMEVTEYLGRVVPKTFELALIPILFVPLIGIRLGVFSARHRNSSKDSVVRTFASATSAIPIFVVGMSVQYVMYQLNLLLGLNLPVIGYKSGGYPDPPFVTGFRTIDCIIANEQVLLLDSLKHMIVPWCVMILTSIASITRQTRSSMLDVLEYDYIRTARAKGCEEFDVYHKHGLKNAMIPVMVFIGYTITNLITGSIMIETVFNFNGMGSAMLSSIQAKDYWVINGVVIVIAFILLLSYVIIDILYVFLDPRIKYD
jgi:peptide/nickel transport system permease protein